MTPKKELYFELGMGTRLRRFYERMSTDADRIYEEAGISFRVSYFYVMYALTVRGSMTIAEIAKLAGFTHSAVSQTIKKLVKEGLVETRATADGRQKQVCISVRGAELHKTLMPYWSAMESSMKDAIAESELDLLKSLDALEGAFDNKSLYKRVHEKFLAAENPENSSRSFKIEPYDARFRQDFYDLNIGWIKDFFKVEPIDQQVLSEPEKHILGEGGEILFAVEDGKAVGTVAMKMMGTGRYELTKLGVDPNSRKGGIGAALCNAVIDRFKARAGKTLFLETNTILENSIRLYWKLGFVELPNPVPSPYERSNYYMEWSEPGDKVGPKP